MKKKDFITLLIGVVAGLLFSIGLCMCLIPEWNTFDVGVKVTAIGIIGLVVLAAVRFKQAGMKLNVDVKLVGKILFGILGALVLGIGMCMIMVWEMMIPGIVVGIVGIILLLCLIPMCLGLK